jgi:hypothetical protein
MFLFKFYNNTLGLNVRVSHFTAGHNRACSLCLIRNDGESEEESFFHLFYDCITTRTLHELFITRWLPDTPLTIENKKKLWFYGALPSDEKLNLFHCTALLLFQFQIWQCKLSKKVPSFHTLSINMTEDLKEIVYNNGKIKKEFLRSNNNLCRIIGAEPAQDE